MEKRDKLGILITGGGRRIGASIAKALAADGWFVYIHCHKSFDEAELVPVSYTHLTLPTSYLV